MVQIDYEELIDLVVGLCLLGFFSTLIGYCMARISRDNDEDDIQTTVAQSCCGCIARKPAPTREFMSLNDLIANIDDDDENHHNNEIGKVVSGGCDDTTIQTTIIQRKQSYDLSDSENEDCNIDRQEAYYSLSSIFPNILSSDYASNNINIKSTNKQRDHSSSLEEPLLQEQEQ